MMISLPPALEHRVRDEARLHGVEPSEYAQRLLDEHLAPTADVTPVEGEPVYGGCGGMLTVVAEDDEHLKDFDEYMR